MTGAFQFDAPASHVALGPRGELAVGGMQGGRGAVAVFDAQGAAILRATEHARPARYSGPEGVAVALSPAGDRIASGSCDKRAVVRDVASGLAVAELPNPDPILDVVWHSNTLVVFGQTHVVLWDEQPAGKFRERAILDRADARVLGAHGGVVFVRQGRSTLAWFDISIGMVVRAGLGGPGAAAMERGGGYALAAEGAGRPAKIISIYGDFGGKPARVQVEAPPAALAFAPSGDRLVAALTDGVVLSIAITAAPRARRASIVGRRRVAGALPAGARLAVVEDGRVALAAGGAGLFLIDAPKSPDDRV